jgi:heptosyltransferase-2
MFFDQGVLKPGNTVAGRQVTVNQAQSQQNNLGLSVSRIQRLIQTGKPNICIIRSLGGIGDVLMTTPMVRALKAQWPEGHLTYATDFAYMDGALRDVLLHNPYIDKLEQFQVAKSKEYDLKVDVTSVCLGTEKSGMKNVPNRIDLFAQHVGVPLSKSGYLPTYIVSDKEKHWAKEKLSRYPQRGSSGLRVGIQVRSSTVSRSWPLDRVRDLAINLSHDLGIQVVIFDSSYGSGPQEDWNISGIVSFKDYKIRDVAALINEMDLMITPDSGLMHIAGALNKKIVSIWAGTDPASRINHYPNAVAIARTDYTCFPCWYSPTACAKSYLCLKSITVEEVEEEVVKLLKMDSIPVMSVKSREIDTIYVRRDVGGYGDLCCITCGIRELKERNQSLKIKMVTPEKYHCIFKNNPAVEECLTLDAAAKIGCSRIYDLTDVDARIETSELRQSGKVITTRPEIYITSMGGTVSDLSDESFVPDIYLKEEEIKWASERFMSDKDYTYILTTLTTAEQYRNWKEEKYFEVFEMAKAQDKKWKFIVHGKDRLEHELPSNVIDASGFSFDRTMAIVKASDIVLTPDTSILHLAAAFNIPCLALFGPIGSDIRCKFYKNTTVIRADLDCVPCWRNSQIKCKKLEGAEDTGLSYCMSAIPSRLVFESLEKLCKRLKH